MDKIDETLQLIKANSIEKLSIKLITQHIRTCNQALKKYKLKVGQKSKILSKISLLKRTRCILKLKNQNFTLKKSEKKVCWENINSCFNNRVRTGVIINVKHKEIKAFLADAFTLFKNRITTISKEIPVLKVNTTFWADFVKQSDDQDIIDQKHFVTPNAVLDQGTNLNEWFQNNVIDIILNKLSEFSEEGSGWALLRILLLEVAINKYEIGNGTSFIRLPAQIEKKKACINIQNNDEACFFWSIISALYPPTKNYRYTSSYPNYNRVLKTEGLEIPIKLNQIGKFEKLNDISVNVYALELNETKNTSFYVVVPARLTRKKLEQHVNLLLIQNHYFPKLNDYEAPQQDNEDIEIKFHYCWIKNLSRLLSSQVNKSKAKIHVCDRCLNYFSSGDKLKDHAIICENNNDCRISFPKYDFVEFRNHIYKQKVPFIIYADFESILAPCKTKLSKTTTKYQHHEPFCAGYFLKCNYNDSLSYFNSHIGDNCMEWFSNEIKNVARFIESRIVCTIPILVKINTVNATICHICEKTFRENDIIVRDHDHFTGKFRGFAHQDCNLSFRKLFIVPVVFHNLSGYDSHFIIKDIVKHGCVSVLPVNKEKYISFTLCEGDTRVKFRFIDSFRFMGAGLDDLVSTLCFDNFYNLKREFKDLDDDTFKLLTRKGVFPYDYVDHKEKLKDIKLPSIDEFYNKLNDLELCREEYIHAQNIWQAFKLTTLGEYSHLYMKTDILLLADVMENFRETALKTYGLDPGWYFTMPGYTWDAMLKYTKCKLQILKDVDMVMFIEKAIRGGISVCCNRFSEANNRYMPEYNATKPSKSIMYLDINNLYGYSMMQALPFEGFKWSDTNIDVTTVPDDSPVGYILQVDLKYPKQLHDVHKDFPFCANHRIPPSSKLPKLIADLYDKKEYILHYRNLKQALAHGLVLTKIHKVLEFKQSEWLKPYIELNTRMRAAATSTFEKNQFKLANNAVFGKTMENKRLHRIVKLINRYEGRYGAKNLIASPRFHNRVIFDEANNFMAIELKKAEIIFDKPLYIGMVILDLSKICMYDFHYNFMLPTQGVDNCKLLYTDTDSFIYELNCDDIYQDIIKKYIHKFDTSDYDKNNIYNIPLINKKVPGLMKDEVNGKIITHFAGLRSKMYTFKTQVTEHDKERLKKKFEKMGISKKRAEIEIKNLGVKKKSKGIKKNVVKNNITFEDYVACLQEFKEKLITQQTIRSIAHDVFSIEQTKIALSPYDDKRRLIPNSFETLPWGHYSDII